MHFGTPVVPDEKSTYHGWSKPNRWGANGVPRCGSRNSSHPVVPADASPTTMVARQGGKAGADVFEALEAVEALAAVAVAVDGEQHHRLDLAEPVEHARGAEVG